jgi:GTPase SAR1 family protein
VEEYSSKVEEKHVDIKIRVAPIVNNSHNLAIHKKHMRNADAVVIVYDVTNTSSFTNVHYWNELVYNAKQERNFVKCVIGNKSDQDEERSILSSAALEYCQGEKIPLFFETNFKEFDKNRQIFKKIGEVLTKEKLETDTTTIWKPVDDSSKDCIVM